MSGHIGNTHKKVRSWLDICIQDNNKFEEIIDNSFRNLVKITVEDIGNHVPSVEHSETNSEQMEYRWASKKSCGIDKVSDIAKERAGEDITFFLTTNTVSTSAITQLTKRRHFWYQFLSQE